MKSSKEKLKNNSLAKNFPHLIKEWHPEKNGELTPYDVTTGSGKKVWWRCKNGHEWQAVVFSRANGKNCPYCSNQLVHINNCLATVHPVLAKEWHPDKNDNLTPYDVTTGSGKKVWWKCKNGHEWQTTIVKRYSGNKCPYCTNKLTTSDNCLAAIKPNLAKEWHPEENGNLTPSDVIPGSTKKVWWKCDQGHEWQATIASRNSGTGCPGCYHELKAEGYYDR